VIVKAPRFAQVLLVRPGATLFDDQGRIKGNLDVPMSDRGRQQARTLSEDLSQFELRAIYSAPCESAIETAGRIADSQAEDGREVPIKIVDAFRNIDHGLWHGKLIDELKRNHPRLYRKGQDSPGDICPPNGESIRDAQARVIKAVRKVLRKSSGHVVAIVIPDPMAWVVQSLLSGDELSNLWNAETDSGSWKLVETPCR